MKINSELSKSKKLLAKAFNKYLNSKEYKEMIEAFKKVGAIN